MVDANSIVLLIQVHKNADDDDFTIHLHCVQLIFLRNASPLSILLHSSLGALIVSKLHEGTIKKTVNAAFFSLLQITIECRLRLMTRTHRNALWISKCLRSLATDLVISGDGERLCIVSYDRLLLNYKQPIDSLYANEFPRWPSSTTVIECRFPSL